MPPKAATVICNRAGRATYKLTDLRGHWWSTIRSGKSAGVSPRSRRRITPRQMMRVTAERGVW